MQVDERQLNGDYWLSGSQIFRLMRGINESLAGRVGLLNLFPLSQNEIFNHQECKPLEFEFDALKERVKNIPATTPVEIFSRIFNGGMPQVIANGTENRSKFYESYILMC
jgi:hypothetical protein